METALNYTTAQIIVGIFLLVTLVVGLWAGRNVKDMKDYALANKQFGAVVLTITFIATLIDGSDAQTLPGRIFSVGLVEWISRPGVALSFLLFGWLIAPKLYKFKGCLTLGEIAELLFSSNARIITGLFGFLGSILWISIQIMVLGPIGSSLLGVDESYAVLVGGMIMVIYASIGGVRAVTMTDILQFIALVLCITLMAGTVVYHAGGLKAIWTKVSMTHPEKLQIVEHRRFTIKTLHFVYNSLGFTLLFLPSFIQRLLMGKNSKEVRKMLVGSAVIQSLFMGAIIVIALGGLALFPESDPSQIMSHISNSLFSKSIQAILQVGFIAIVMSTVDSYLSSSGLVLTHDVIKPLCDRFQIRINELKIVKWITFVAGTSSILLAVLMGTKGMLNTIPVLADYANEVISIIGVPMCIGIMGLIPDRKSFVVGIVAAVGMLDAMHTLNVDAVTSELINLGSMVANAVAFLLTHYLVNGGFKYTEVIDMGPGNPPLVKARTWHPSLYGFTLWVDRYLPNLHNVLEYSRIKVKKYGHYVKPLLGYYVVILLAWGVMAFMKIASMNSLSLSLRILGLFPLLVFLSGGALERKVRRYFPIFWHLTVLYCLPFLLTFVYLWEGGGTILSIELVLGMVMLMLLVDRKSFWILKLGGVSLACGVYFLVKGINPLTMSTDGLLLFSGYGGAMVLVRSGLQPVIKKYRAIKRESRYKKDMEEIMYSGISWGEKFRGEELGRIQDIIPYMEQILEDKQVNSEREHVFVVTLDSASQIINIKMLHLGTKDHTLFVSKDVLNEAVMRDASGIILVHNHPNGDPRPSREDERSTTDLLHACHYVGVMLMDHLIITKKGTYFSFRASGHIGKVEEELQELTLLHEQLDRKIEKTEKHIAECMEMLEHRKAEEKDKKKTKTKTKPKLKRRKK